MAHKANIARQVIEPLPARDRVLVTREDVERMIAEIAGGGAAPGALVAGPGVKIEAALNAQGALQYTISLDLSLESASENLTITTKETTP